MELILNISKKPLGTAGFLSILKHKNTNLVVTNAMYILN